jgi:hypothetical protein
MKQKLPPDIEKYFNDVASVVTRLDLISSMCRRSITAKS